MIKKLWPTTALAPISLEQALETFKGSKHALYQRAYDSLRAEPLCARDARIKAFVKAERFDPDDKVNPDPRMIQARNPRYNLHLARYMRGLEHRIYSLHVHGMPVVVKCKNPQQRAEILLEKWKSFDNPVCVSLDASRWDKHVSSEMLRVEHDFYLSHFPRDPELDQLLRWQAVNRCVTSNGVKYEVVGGRMSGDMNTASGNIILACGMVFSAAKKLNLGHFEVVDDGDDMLLMFEADHLERVRTSIPEIFLTYGQELKIENIAHDFHDILFCQARVTWNGERYTMARNWRKVLSQSCCGTKHWNDPFMVRPMFGLLGDCEMAQHAGIPILQAFASRLRELSCGQRARMVHLDSSYQYRMGGYSVSQVADVVSRPVSARARFEFEQTWKVSPSEQIAIESAISRWAPEIDLRDVGREIFEPWVQYLDPGLANPTCL